MWSSPHTDHRPGVYLCIGCLHLPKEEHRPGLVEGVFVDIEPEEGQYDFSVLLPQRELGGVTHGRRGDSLQAKEGTVIQHATAEREAVHSKEIKQHIIPNLPPHPPWNKTPTKLLLPGINTANTPLPFSARGTNLADEHLQCGKSMLGTGRE